MLNRGLRKHIEEGGNPSLSFHRHGVVLCSGRVVRLYVLNTPCMEQRALEADRKGRQCGYLTVNMHLQTTMCI